MKRGDRPAKSRTSDNAVDPLEEALRQVGAEILDEPVPERLRQVLRRARERSADAPGSPGNENRDEPEER